MASPEDLTPSRIGGKLRDPEHSGALPHRPDEIDPSTVTWQDWRRQQPFYRRCLARIGLQGKLICGFAYILLVALGASCWLFATESSSRVSQIMGDQTRQMAYALALASKPSFEAGQRTELARIGQSLLQSRNILFVAFLDSQGRPLTLSSRDGDFGWQQIEKLRHNTSGLMQVQAYRWQRENSKEDYLGVMSPVMRIALPPCSRAANLAAGAAPGSQSADGAPPGPDETPNKLLGYVAVGISQVREQQQLRGISFLVVAAGGVVILMMLPFAYVLVHRVFLPIRQLVSATNRIIAGDLQTSVAIHRPDAIGALARSFNEMVVRLRMQQHAIEEANEALADANIRLAEANASLETKVQQRTIELESANKKLSSEIAEKEDFLRAVSHDLNAPLRNISGMAAMLLMKHREKFDEEIIHRLERIQKNVEVETDLIAELLELSRIKTRRQKVELIDIGQLVREVGDLFESDLKDRGISLTLENDLPRLRCERGRMRQVFQNLLDNAIKYMGDGPGREIHIGCAGGASRGPEGPTEFYVRDTGLGIEESDLAKVFFIFRRGKSSAARNVSGKGVGLATVKSIIETYGGSIWVESAVGRGSTFRFTIVERTDVASPEENLCGSLSGAQAA